MVNIPHILSLLKSTIWAIRPEKLDEIVAFLQMRTEGRLADPVESPDRLVQHWSLDDVGDLQVRFYGEPAAAQANGGAPKLGIAVLPLFGIIGQRMNILMKFSGGTSTELFTRDLRGLIADSEVGGIVIDNDSPGGGVYGTPELAEEIYKSRGKKPIWTIANSMAASAAYWIGTAADEMIVTPGGEVGSVGIYAVHEDFSKAKEEQGIKVTYIKAGRFKTTGNPDEPLDDEGRAHIQEGVDRYYDMFVAALAKHRGVSVNDVRSGFGEGGMVGAKDAVRIGMADRVATLDETISRMLRTVNSAATARAAAAPAAPQPCDEELRARMRMA